MYIMQYVGGEVALWLIGRQKLVYVCENMVSLLRLQTS